MSYSLLPYIFNSCWFISEGSVQGLLPVVKSIYKGELPKIDAEEKLRHQMYQISCASDSSSNNDSNGDPNENKKYIAVIPVMDVITLQDQFCGPRGTYTKSAYLDQAGRDPNVESVILFIDSPGGEAHAMFQLTNAINDFKTNYNKPIVAYVGSMAASAAYGIATACDRIVASDKHSFLGSIGTYITVLDQKKNLESKGIFIHEIYAADSTNKNLEWKAAIAGDDKPMLAMLKKYNDRFISIVKTGRPDIKENDKIKPFTGQTIFGSDALDAKMIDEIGNMNVAVQHCTQLKSNYSQTQNNMKISFKSGWAAIASLFPSKKEGDDVTEADVEQMNTRLTESKTSIDQLTKQVTEKDAEITTLSTQVSEKDAEIAILTKNVSDAATASETLQTTLNETQTQLDTANAELAKRQGTVATSPEVETEKIKTTQAVKYDDVNEYVKGLNK